MTGGHDPGRRPRPVDRRTFLTRSAALAGAAALLAGCGDGGGTGPAVADDAGLAVASPAQPVTWPISEDNQPISEGQEPEGRATLRLYNWKDYLNTEAIRKFEREYRRYGVKVEVATFETLEEATAKLNSGAVLADVFFPTYDRLGKLIQAGLLRPLNHAYIPNIDQAWPTFSNPFYDQDWRYSVPYAVYGTGIAWREDKVREDVAGHPNPYELFWDRRYRGQVSVIDEYREAMGMVLLKNGITDLATASPTHLALVKRELMAMAEEMRPVVDAYGYTRLPEAKVAISQAWSGDVINVQYLFPKGQGQSQKVLRYWSPLNGRGAVNNDLMVILRSGKSPVLAHHFLNFLLDSGNAMLNFEYTGYQPPQSKVDPDVLVEQGFIPENLKSVVIRPEYFDNGYRNLELSPQVDRAWLTIWEAFKRAL